MSQPEERCPHCGEIMPCTYWREETIQLPKDSTYGTDVDPTPFAFELATYSTPVFDESGRKIGYVTIQPEVETTMYVDLPGDGTNL